MKKIIINKRFMYLIFMFCFQLAGMSYARAETYRQCIISTMSEFIKSNPCQFDRFYSGETSAHSSCGNLLLKEIMADKSLAMGSDEFKSALDNKKRSGVGDAEELVSKEGTRCGVTATMRGDKVTVTQGTK